MKRISAFILLSVILMFCGCFDDKSISSSGKSNSSIADISSDLQSTVSEYDTKNNGVSMSGGFNYSYSETTPIEYNGEDIVMHVRMNISNSTDTDMGVYLNVQGYFLPFSMQEYSDESFTQPLSDESKSEIFHQLNFDKACCEENKDRYFSVKFNPDMFEKGSVVYPDVVCSVNNTYLPESDGSVNISASNLFGIYPPTLKINCDAKQKYKTCKKYDTKPMTSQNADEYENENVKAEILKKGDESFQYLVKAKKGEPLKLTARVHNVYSEYLKFDTQKTVMSVLVNDKPYAVFDESEYLEIDVEQNTYYTYDFELDSNDLNEMNKVQIYACQLKGTEQNPYNTIAISTPLYVQVEE